MSARILLVDDYEDALSTWALFLRLRGFEVFTARDGKTAVQIALELVPDLIVMDLVLPGVTGCEAARLIRASARAQHVPIIATTGSTLPALLSEATASGFVSVRIKPCDPQDLLAEIERVLDDRAMSGATQTIGHPSGEAGRSEERSPHNSR
jgi:twitching motility two-component system response regulator PilH